MLKRAASTLLRALVVCFRLDRITLGVEVVTGVSHRGGDFKLEVTVNTAILSERVRGLTSFA